MNANERESEESISVDSRAFAVSTEIRTVSEADGRALGEASVGVHRWFQCLNRRALAEAYHAERGIRNDD